MPGTGDNALGLYVSIPFCRSKCTYCNFASGVYPASGHARYVDRLIQDMAGAGAWAAQMAVELPRRVGSVYLGGGTPSLLAPDLLARLFQAMRAEFDFAQDAEITVECAPGQLADETLAALAEAGVNRVSLGVQSFIDSETRAIGRLHSRAVALADIDRLRAVGITNLNVDLIAGLPGQTFASWDESLAALVDSGTPHASVYMLEVDEDSRLGRELLAGGARYHAEQVPSDDDIARMYEIAIEKLGAAGIDQYEISNFARPGFSSSHNLRYWQRQPYLGLGLDASSMLCATPDEKDSEEPRYVLRSSTTDDLQAFLDGTQPAETAWLSPARQYEEAWFLGMRLNAGVNVAGVEREFGRKTIAPVMETIARLVDDGLLKSKDGIVRLTARGRLLSNEVFQEFLGLVPDEGRARHS
jgi:oxygen-independent coproporphyrinogen-3 oxidase